MSSQSNEYILLDTRIIKEAISKKQDMLNEYNSIVSDFESSVNTLLNNWKGYGADSFNDDVGKLKRNFGEFSDRLRSLSDMLDDILMLIEQKDTELGNYNTDPK